LEVTAYEGGSNDSFWMRYSMNHARMCSLRTRPAIEGVLRIQSA
jgi:hypothetical protein